MEGCKEAGIPCFGTLWDFVRLSYFCIHKLRLTVASVKEHKLFLDTTNLHIYRRVMDHQT
jgi:hypothetical protein